MLSSSLYIMMFRTKIQYSEFLNFTLSITVIVFATGFNIHKMFHVSSVNNSKDTGNCEPLVLSIKEEKYIS